MKQSLFLKATIVASVLIVNTFPLLATEIAKESIIKATHTLGEKLEDTTITSKVKMALLLHRSTATFKTELTTINGVVIINGTVQNNAEKDLITKFVEDVHGVKSVQNEMLVANVDTSTVGENLDDAIITTKVKMALVLNRSTGALRTSVSTNDSVVTLSGKAQSEAEKELVSKVVEDVEGVKSVVNNMVFE